MDLSEGRVHARNIRLDPTLDPLDVGLNEVVRQLIERLTAVEKALAPVAPSETVMAAPPRQDQRSANIQRLTNAYLLLAGKSVKVKLSVEYVVGDDPEEVLLYLPSEAT